MGDFGDKVIRYVFGFVVGVVAGLYLAGNVGVIVFYQAPPSAKHKSF